MGMLSTVQNFVFPRGLLGNSDNKPPFHDLELVLHLISNRGFAFKKRYSRECGMPEIFGYFGPKYFFHNNSPCPTRFILQSVQEMPI